MLSGRITHVALRLLDKVGERFAPQTIAEHRRTGQRGEQDAYFYLRRRGYTMVARNYRSPRRHGEIDLIGWDADVLCFVEVKARSANDLMPAEAAVDRKKRDEVIAVAREYLRLLPPDCHWRFDLVSVYYGVPREPLRFELFKDVLPLS
jgi:putative endonuclease